jgi:hypothetical protein
MPGLFVQDEAPEYELLALDNLQLPSEAQQALDARVSSCGGGPRREEGEKMVYCRKSPAGETGVLEHSKTSKTNTSRRVLRDKLTCRVLRECRVRARSPIHLLTPGNSSRTQRLSMDYFPPTNFRCPGNSSRTKRLSMSYSRVNSKSPVLSPVNYKFGQLSQFVQDEASEYGLFKK